MLPRQPTPLMSSMMMMGMGSSASGGGAGFVGALDDYSGSLAGAWSVARRLFSGYTGALIRVRRSSDNAEQDIGFATLGGLDTTALLAFCGGGDGYVTKLYDQLSTGTLVQGTAAKQMQIVSSGTVVIDAAGKVAMTAPSSGKLFYSVSITPTQTFTQFVACAPVNTTGSSAFIGSLRNDDIDTWHIGQTGTDWTFVNSLYGDSLTVAGAASGRKAVSSSFDSRITPTPLTLRESSHVGSYSVGASGYYGASVQLGSQIYSNSIRSGDMISEGLHANTVLDNTTRDAINLILAAG